MLKLCKDCIFFNVDNSCCQRLSKFNPITGKTEINYIHCLDERSYPFILDILLKACGKRGRFFKLKSDEK